MAPSCDRAVAALDDPSPHIALPGNGCPARIPEIIVDRSEDWRRQARALVSLNKFSLGSAEQRFWIASRKGTLFKPST